MSGVTPENARGAELPALDLSRTRRRALLVALPAALLCVLGAVLDPAQLLRSYLVAYVFWLSIALGCLAIEMLGHVISGVWTVVIRRPLEAASRTIAPLALLFIPILLGLRVLYPWAVPGAAEQSEAIAHKAPYLNAPFFIGRTIGYFAVWILLATLLSRMSLAQDRGRDEALARRMRKLSAVGLMLYCATMTFASIDWMMSLEPRWYSTIYGVYVIGGQAVAGMAFAVLAARLIAARSSRLAPIEEGRFHDFGRMLLAFMMLWAYFAFSQLLIVWSGNLPEEAVYYQARLGGGLRWVSLSLVILGFAVPFLLLLPRAWKKDPRKLSAVALLLLAVRWIDLHWLIAPAFHPRRIVLHWLDVACFVAIGGVWLFLFLRELAARPLLPAGDPLLSEAMEHAHE